MTQIVLNRQLLVFTMSPEKFFEIYKGFNSPYPTHKKNYTCGFSDTAGFTNQVKFCKSGQDRPKSMCVSKYCKGTFCCF